MSVVGLLILGNVLVGVLPVLDFICLWWYGTLFVGVRAGWTCFAIGSAALLVSSVVVAFTPGVVVNAIAVTYGGWQMWRHWHDDDDDDDWPGPRKLTEWAKRKLARSRPIPVPVQR